VSQDDEKTSISPHFRHFVAFVYFVCNSLAGRVRLYDSDSSRVFVQLLLFASNILKIIISWDYKEGKEMATGWGAYFASYVKKKEEAPKVESGADDLSIVPTKASKHFNQTMHSELTSNSAHERIIPLEYNHEEALQQSSSANHRCPAHEIKLQCC
jgi:hypothetical protein